MANYQKYAEYQDSGIGWMGAIPEHWIITSLKRYSYVKGGYAFSSDIFTSVGKPIIRIGDIQADGSISLENCKYIPLTVAENSQDYFVTKGQILMAMTGATIGKAGIFDSNEVAYLNQRVGKFIIDSKALDYGYLWYLLKTHGYQEYIRLTAFGGAQPNISDTAMVDFNTCIPSLLEQVAIANFLDHETAKIDSLIAKQQKLIELLKEKRQAVISHTVTKGLNPDVVMKGSGVEWLGEVPEHWGVIKFNHCVQIRNGLVDPRQNNYKNLVLYAPNHIEKGTGKIIYKETADEQGADSNKYFCFKGEVIYSKIRPALAKVAICEEDLALCSADMYPMDGFNGLSNKFLYYFILSDSFTEAVILDSDRVAMPKINRESLSEYKLPIPPLEEQLRITAFIETTGCNLDKLEQQAQKAIQLMQERRTALISSAVTGKIDVRNWQKPNKNNDAKTEFGA